MILPEVDLINSSVSRGAILSMESKLISNCFAIVLALGLVCTLVTTQSNDTSTSGADIQATTLIPSNASIVPPSIPNSSSNKTNKSANSKNKSTKDCPAECICSDRKISCDDKKFKSIPDLRKSTNITEISFRNNSLEVLDFAQLPIGSLESLDVSSNFIKTLVAPTKKVDTLAKLKVLNLANNMIDNLQNFSAWKFPILDTLDLSENAFEDIGSLAFNNVRNITTLKLENNDIKSIQESTFQYLTQLKFLNMSTALRKIHLGDKQFVNNQKLEVLDLTDNALIEVPFALRSTSSIRTLILNANSMTSLRQSDFINRSELTYLSIRECPKLTKIDEMAFSELYSLKTLIVAGNTNLQFISKDAFKSEREHRLDLLDFSGNNLTTITDPLEFSSLNFSQIRLNNNPWNCNCDLKWLLTFPVNRRSPMHCKTPDQYKDIEMSNFFSTIDCEVEDSNAHKIILLGFLIFFLGLVVSIFAQKSDAFRRLFWKDKYGTIYYTKASFPPETA